MKRILALLLALCMVLGLSGCGKKKKEEAPVIAAIATPTPNEVFEVKLNLANLYDYFDYKEFRADFKQDDGTVTSCTISYGLELKEQYAAANDDEHKDTMRLTFTADGEVLSGEFDIDFDTLTFTGTADSRERVKVEENLSFWAKGNRSTVWAYGNYSSSNIMYLENFTVTKVSGSIFIRYAEPGEREQQA
ncbi:MAG: hypothetical protein IJV41_03130 [Oscillospiraceae bacterium]|nr:hypothetical protein [Oscillospiraceae bacterium]